MKTCPEGVKRRADVLYHNSFIGFQPPTDTSGSNKDCFVICIFDDSKLIADIEAIKKEAQCLTLCEDDWIGRDYLRVHWSEYNRIPVVLNTLLKRGHSFQTMTKGMPFFDAKKDKEFNRLILEEKVIQQTSELLSFRLVNIINHACCETWNYVTEEGKAFAKKLLEDPLMANRYDNERTNFYEWPLFTGEYDHETLIGPVAQ